jgi:hypothetical protein
MAEQVKAASKFDALYNKTDDETAEANRELVRATLKNKFRAAYINVKQQVLEAQTHYAARLTGLVNDPTGNSIDALLGQSVNADNATKTMEALRGQYQVIFGEELTLE